MGQRILGACPDCSRSLIENVTHACGAGSGPTPQEQAAAQNARIAVPGIAGEVRYCPEHPSVWVPAGEVCTLCRESERYMGLFADPEAAERELSAAMAKTVFNPEPVPISGEAAALFNSDPAGVRAFIDKRLTEAILREEEKIEDEIMNGNGRDGRVLETLHGVHLTSIRIDNRTNNPVKMDVEMVQAPEGSEEAKLGFTFTLEDDPLDPMVEAVFADAYGEEEEDEEAVEHPQHYGGADNPYEAIKVIEAQGLGRGFCLGNALKYILRAGKKSGRRRTDAEVEDLKKAVWYLERVIENEAYRESDKTA